MTIEQGYKKEFDRRYIVAACHTNSRLKSVRDAGRQACYDWENKHLRPGTVALPRGDAKGLARLAGKKAIALMEQRGLVRDDADRQAMLASLRVALTKENAGHCWGGTGGVYFARWGWTKPILLHEVAHWADQWAQMLAARNAGRVVAEHHGHGPKWRGWFLWLLANVEWAGHRYDLAALPRMPGGHVMP